MDQIWDKSLPNIWSDNSISLEFYTVWAWWSRSVTWAGLTLNFDIPLLGQMKIWQNQLVCWVRWCYTQIKVNPVMLFFGHLIVWEDQ